MPELAKKANQPSPAPDVLNLPPKVPRIPDEVLDRFPGMEDYQKAMDKWWEACFNILSDNNEDVATVSNTNASGLINMRVTINGVTASIEEEAIIRADHDGNLAGKYTLTVTAGNVVTGMNITSATGPGTNISDVTFVATNFKIYNGVTGITMFNVSAGTVQLAGTLVVSTSGKVYIGVGNYNNTDTAFYVDSSGNFSLKDKLSWDGTTLSINGVVNSTSGTIGGFTLSGGALTASSGVSYIAINASGSSGIQFGDGSASTRTVQISNDQIAVYEGGQVVGFMTQAGAAGSRYGFLELLNSAGTPTFIASGSAGTLALGSYLTLQPADVGRVSFGSNYINENNGLGLNSQGTSWPVRIFNGALMMNGGSDLGSSYFNAGVIYWSSTVYLHESGGLLWLNDGSGDRPIT